MVEKLLSEVSTKKPRGHNKRSFLARRLHNEHIKCTTTRGTGHHVKLCGRTRNSRHTCQPSACTISNILWTNKLGSSMGNRWWSFNISRGSTTSNGGASKDSGHTRHWSCDLDKQRSVPSFWSAQGHWNWVICCMCSPEAEKRNGTTFYVGKVCALNCVADIEGMMHIIWYWPKMPRGSTDAPGEWHQRYSSCVQRAWIPSREPDDWIFVGSAMTSWKNTTSTLMCTVHGVQVEKENQNSSWRGSSHSCLCISRSPNYWRREYAKYLDVRE